MLGTLVGGLGIRDVADAVAANLRRVTVLHDPDRLRVLPLTNDQMVDHEPPCTARTKKAEALSMPATSPVRKNTPHAEGNGRLPTMDVVDQ